MVIGKEEEYANHLDNQIHLADVTASANRSKGAKDWQPPDETFWYEYALYWTVAKTPWELTMTRVEADAVIEMLSTCPVEVEVEVWEALEPATGEHKPEPTEEPESSVYGSCEEAAEAGVPRAMVPSAKDGDGVLCEK